MKVEKFPKFTLKTLKLAGSAPAKGVPGSDDREDFVKFSMTGEFKAELWSIK